MLCSFGTIHRLKCVLKHITFHIILCDHAYTRQLHVKCETGLREVGEQGKGMDGLKLWVKAR